MQPIYMIMIYYWDKKLKKKRLHVLEADIITIENKHWFDVSSSKDAFFLQDVFQMTTIMLVSVIKHYHIYGLRVFWDTVYKTSSNWCFILVFVYLPNISFVFI